MGFVIVNLHMTMGRERLCVFCLLDSDWKERHAADADVFFFFVFYDTADSGIETLQSIQFVVT